MNGLRFPLKKQWKSSCINQHRKSVRHNSRSHQVGACVASVSGQTRILQAIMIWSLFDFLRPVTREWQCLSCLLRAACECFCPPNRKAAEMLQRLPRFTWSEVELEMLEGSYKRNESHALVRTRTYKKAIEIRFRTLGAHPDTGFDPKKGLWSSLYWLLIHRCTHLHADILQPSLQGFVFKWN